MTTTLPPMLTPPEAASLLRRAQSTIYYQIQHGTFDLPCTKKPPRVQTRAVLALTGLTEAEAAEYLETFSEGTAA